MTQVRSLIYDHFNDDKFITNRSGERILNQKYLAGIREFNLLKKLVANCQDSTGMVDTQLLKSLVDQVNLRVEMMSIEMRVNDLDIGMS